MINEIKKRIIDKRIKEKFMIDDAYLNGQAKICGWQATLAYNSLCRHSNISQESFPSIKLMAQELGISRETIMKGLENLEKYNVIQIKKNRTKGGQWLNNTYTLIDKSEWIKHQVADTDLVDQVAVSYTPSGCEPLDQVAVSHTKETHKQGNTYKETHSAEKKSPHPPLKKELTPLQREFNLLWDYFKEQYAQKISEEPPIMSYPKLFKIGQPILRQFGLEPLKRKIDLYFDRDDPFFKRVGWSMDIFLMSTTLNGLK